MWDAPKATIRGCGTYRVSVEFERWFENSLYITFLFLCLAVAHQPDGREVVVISRGLRRPVLAFPTLSFVWILVVRCLLLSFAQPSCNIMAGLHKKCFIMQEAHGLPERSGCNSLQSRFISCLHWYTTRGRTCLSTVGAQSDRRAKVYQIR